MKKYLLVFVTIIFTSFLSAQTISAQTHAVKSIAEVNVQGAKIANQIGQSINISFTISNGSGIQTGLQYSVRLSSKSNRSIVVDEKHYDEVLSLPENSSISKSIVYNAPTGLSGVYLLSIGVSNKAGFPFANASVGEVSLSSTQGLVVVPGSCILSEKNTKVACEAQNITKNLFISTPVLSVFEQSSFNKPIAEVFSQNPLSFKAESKQTFLIDIPKTLPSGFYILKIQLRSGETLSNTVSIPLIIPGVSAKILNASLDADYYKYRGIAEVDLSWAGSGATKVDVKLSSHNITCGVAEVALVSHVQKISIKNRISCTNPVLSVNIKDSEGNILDSFESSIETTSTKAPQKQKFLALGIIILALIIFVVRLLKNNKKIPPMGSATVATFIFVLASFTSYVEANTYYAGANNEVLVTVNADNPLNPGSLNFNQGDTINVDGSIQNLTDLSQTVSLSAVTINNNSVDLFNPSTITLTPFEIRLANNPGSFTVNVPTNPPLPQSFDITFTAGLLEPVYIKLTEQGVSTWQETISQGAICPPVILNHRNVTSVLVEFYSDITGTTPLDVTGLGFKLVLREGQSYPLTDTYSITTVLSGTSYTISPGYSYNEVLGNFLPPFTFGCGGIALPNTSGKTAHVGVPPYLPWVITPPVNYARILYPPSPEITASATYANVGDTVTITWSSGWAGGVTTCTGTNFSTAGAPYGTQSVTVTSIPITYSVSCSNAAGSGTDSVTLTPEPPVITFSASPTSIVTPDSTTLSWSSTNATSCSSVDFYTGNQTAGNSVVYPSVQPATTYNIECVGPGGTSPAQLQVDVVESCPPDKECQQ
ncbi:MAG TPA: hypothetical protein PLQ20_00015 [Candidatus Paceibacterota bacterium]|nr:hypothetical protein [Candidatus Paceibacterota bacterium]